jgi:hypothetical protein
MDNIQNLKELLMKGMFGDDAIKTWVTGYEIVASDREGLL